MANALTRFASRVLGGDESPRVPLAPLVGMQHVRRDDIPEESAQRSVGSSIDDGFGWAIVAGEQPTVFQGSGREVRQLGFEKHPIVQACVRVVSDIIATVDFEIYSKNKDDEVTLLPTSPALALLHSPRVGMNRVMLRALTAVHFQLYGNAFWVLERERPNGPPTAIRLVHPENVMYGYLDPLSQEIQFYEWRDRVGIVRRTSYMDIIHFRDLVGGDWLFGYPRAAAALIDISSDYEAGQFVRQVVKNNGSPSLAVLLEGNPGRAEMQAGEERWQEKMVRRGQRGNTAFMAGVKSLQQIAFNFRDLEFTALRGIAREDICAVFAVDPRMIAVASAKGAEGGLSGVQYREARFRLIQQTILPIMGVLEATLDDSFCPEFGNVYARFSPDKLSKLTENEVETSTRTLAELSGGLITREEGRQRVGLPPDMDIKDTLVGSTGRTEYPVVEQFDHATGEERNPLAGPLDPNAPPQNVPVGPGSPAGAQTPDAATNEKPPTPKGLSKPRAQKRTMFGRYIKRSAVLSAEQRNELWSMFDTRAVAEEGPYRRAASVLFHVEKGKVRDTLEHAKGRSARDVRASTREDASDPYVAAALRAIQGDYAPGGDYHQAWLDRYQGLISKTFSVAGNEVAATVGADFDISNPQVQAAILDRATTLATHVGATTADQITAAVAAGREAGMGISEIADLIDGAVFGGTSSSRATMIARTESVGAMNQGEYVTAKTSGVIQSVEWLTQGDERVRDSHAEQDGERIDLGDTFSNGLQFPGDQNGEAEEVINCRCTLLYHDEDSSDES